MANFIDISGQRFGRLVAIKCIGKEKYGNYLWECQCDCGNVKNSTKSHLLKGYIKSCGCLKKETARENGKKTPRKSKIKNKRLYNIWKNMKQRCLNTNNERYKDYGKRGISICDNWTESFKNFEDDMYESYLEHVESYGERNTTLDRIDNDGNYEPLNCRWATYMIQNNNSRNKIATISEV